MKRTLKERLVLRAVLSMCAQGEITKTEASRLSGVSVRMIVRRLPKGLDWDRARDALVRAGLALRTHSF